MNNKIDAIYARQSVDKQDSISIESQIDFCKYELKGGACKEYTDKGFSGKNTDRPKFQELVRDIEQGLVGRVIVYKLDRISRSIIDFARMMGLFEKYNVEFVSSTEKFDTSTPMGRAMLNICIVFAQLERETIQTRVRDSYYSRCQKGLRMSGAAPYGYQLEPTVLDGIRTKMMVIDPEAAERVKLMFEMYADPATSLGDIARHFTERNISLEGNFLNRSKLAYMLKNPSYVQADLAIYEFFKSQGTVITNDVSDFSGENSCYLYQGKDTVERKTVNMKGQILVLAPHEGLISSDVWLACRRKLLRNPNFGGSRKVKSTWLAGKIKCGLCGTALVASPSKSGAYLRCRLRQDNKACAGCGTIHLSEFEQSIYNEMCEKMGEFQTLTGGNPIKANPRLTALQVELAQLEDEIDKLLDTLIGANATLLSYANSKIEEMDAERGRLTKAIADMTSGMMTAKQVKHISASLENWDDIDFESQRIIVDELITRIGATSESVQIEWKI